MCIPRRIKQSKSKYQRNLGGYFVRKCSIEFRPICWIWYSKRLPDGYVFFCKLPHYISISQLSLTTKKKIFPYQTSFLPLESLPGCILTASLYMFQITCFEHYEMIIHCKTKHTCTLCCGKLIWMCYNLCICSCLFLTEIKLAFSNREWTAVFCFTIYYHFIVYGEALGNCVLL